MKHKLTRITALMLAVIMSFSMLLVPVQAASFTDVPEKAWYRAAVDYVSEKGWMNGVSATSFAPTMDVTRAMFVTLLAAYADVTVDNSNAAFTDTGAGKWYTGSAAWAAGLGIVKGIGDGRFAPNRAITRQDLCVMLYQYLQVSGIELKADADRTYADFASVAAYAKEAVSFCAASGLVTGYEDGSFRPRKTATRAQVAQILMRLDQLRQGQELPEDPMPAQSFNGEAGEAMNVSVEAPEGALPENTEMTVTRVTAVSELASISDKINGELIYAADISFSKDGVELEPAAAVEVQIELDGLEDIENPTVVHVASDGSVEHVSSELVSTTRDGKSKALRFYAKDFSVYAVVSGTNDQQAARLKVQIWKRNAAGNGYEIGSSVFVTRQDLDKLGTIIPDGETPTVASKELFCGWYFDAQSFTGSEAEVRYTEDDVDGEHTMSAARAQVRAYLEAKNDDNTYSHVITDGETTVNIYPIIFYYFNVSYVDENGETTLNTETYYLKTLPADPDDYALEVDVQLTYAPYLQGYRFLGWQKDDGDEKVYENGERAGIKNTNTKFRAQVQQGYWLSFEENPGNHYSGATYIPPVFCPNGVIPANAQPTDPTLNGYTLGDANGNKWYEKYDDNGTDDVTDDIWTDNNSQNVAFNFSGTITKETTVYAKWQLNDTVPFTIIVWKQNIDDDKGLADKDKSYDYAFARTKQVAPNTPVADLINNTDADLKRYTELAGKSNVPVDGVSHSFYGFTYNDTKGVSSDSTVVKPDGSTVVNLYYDRELCTIRFMAQEYTAVSGHPSTSSGTPVYYIYYKNQYCPIRYYTSSYNDVYVPTTSNSGTQYGVVDGVWTELTYRQNTNTGIYGWYYTGSDNKWHKWDGTRYSYSTYGDTTSYTYYTRDWAERDVYTGLYEQKLSKYGYTWPDDYRWMIDDPNGSSFISVMDCFMTGTYLLYGVEEAFDANVYHFLQESDGTWPSSANFTIPCKTTDGMVFRSFSGFSPSQYRVKLPSGVSTYQLSSSIVENAGSTSQNPDFTITWGSSKTATDYHDGAYWTEWIDYDVQVKIGDDTPYDDTHHKPVGCKIEFRYERVKQPISFMYGKFVTGRDEEITSNVPTGQIYQTEPIFFEASVDSYKKGGADYYDPVAKGKFTDESYIFLGWFSDPGCTTPYDFANKTMLQGGITVYAGFKQIEYRVFLHVNEEGKQWSDVAWNDPDQQSNFRITYNSLISDGNPIEGKMNGYVLVGWYTDEACTQPFNFDTRLTNALGSIAQTYGAAEKADPQYATESDGRTNKDVDRPWINHMVHLYAKWRKVLDGATGITVVYDAIEQENTTGKTGKFTEETDQPITWKDPLSYTDQSNLIIRSGSTPDLPADYQFEYWQVLDKDGNVVRQIHPGMLLEIDADWAKVSDAPSTSGNAVAPALPTRNTAAGVPARAANDKYQAVDAPQIGRSYLIGYASGSDVYLIGNTLSDGSYCPTAVSATVSDGIITGDYGAYTWTVGGSSTAMTFQNASAGYLGRSDNYLYFGTTANTWTYTSNKLRNVATSGYRYIVYSSSGYFDVYNSSYAVNLTFYELMEDLGEPVTYTKVDTPVPGISYVIAEDGLNYALSGTNINTTDPDEGESWLKGVEFERSGDNVTIYSNQIPDLTWTAGGNNTDGWTWKNVGNNKYLSITTAGYVTVRQDPHAWLYDENRYFNNQTESEGYYYLFFDTRTGYMDYNLSMEGHAIGLYAKTHTLTVNYVMSDGSEAPAAHVETVPEGVAYSVASPVISGYNVDTATVSGSMGTSDVIVTVTYTPASHTVTFNWHDGSDTQTVNDGEYATAPADPENYVENGITYIFTRWDPQPDATPITADQVFTAQYKREGAFIVTFKDWNGRVLKTEEVMRGRNATAPEEPVREGFTFKGWDKEFTNVQNDLVVYATYATAVTKIYTVTLRAVYGPKENVKNTHVTWYANNGADIEPNKGYKNSNEVVVNNGIDIETLNSYAALKLDGYTFLGWARMPEMADQVQQYAPDFVDKYTVDDVENLDGTTTEKIVSYKGLTENELWLVYHPAEGDKAAYFSVRENNTELNNGAAFTQIAANENTPYHGLYAVWKRDVFYVLHSSDGKLEAVSMPVGTGEASQGMSYAIGTANLTDFVRPGYLYGGYYTDANEDGYAYGYVAHDDVQAVADSYNAAQLNGWSNVASTASADVASVIGSNDLNTALASSGGYIEYNGASLYTNGTNKPYIKENNAYVTDPKTGKKTWTAVWSKADAATADGTNLRPERGKVYYLKEVPSQYLTSKMIYTYDTSKGQNNKLLDVWLVTLLDDANYKTNADDAANTGFYVNENASETAKAAENFQKYDHLTASFSLTQQASSTDPENHPAVTITVNAASFGREGGFVMATRMTGLKDQNSFTMLPSWTTPDGVKVYNNGLTFTKNTDTSDGTKLYTWSRSFDGTEKMYFDLSGNHGASDGWLGAGAVPMMKVWGSTNNPNGQWLMMISTGINDIYYVTMPAGNWTAFLLARVDPRYTQWPEANQNTWNKTGDIQFHCTSNLTGVELNGKESYENYLKDFTDGSYDVTWGWFPE